MVLSKDEAFLGEVALERRRGEGGQKDRDLPGARTEGGMGEVVRRRSRVRLGIARTTSQNYDYQRVPTYKSIPFSFLPIVTAAARDRYFYGRREK